MGFTPQASHSAPAKVTVQSSEQINNLAPVEILRSGMLRIVNLPGSMAVVIGSLEGDGEAVLDHARLTVGRNDSFTTFGGRIGGAGYLTKEGRGAPRLLGNSFFTGQTTVDGGALIANDGTDSHAAQAELHTTAAVPADAPGIRILDFQRVGPHDLWRIRWTAKPGAEYELQRLAEENLPTHRPLTWVSVSSVQATGAVASATDTIGPEVTQRFYRVVLVGTGTNDNVAPLVALQDAMFAALANGVPALKLTFTATDDFGVAGVAVKEGANILGSATYEGGSRWGYVIPIVLGSIEPRYFSATASDLGGNQGNSGPVGILASDPDLFAPVSAGGQIQERHALMVTGANQVADFIFRPGGRPRPGHAPDFFLRFPDGATVLKVNDKMVLEFSRATGDFDTPSPLKLDTPLERTGGPLARLTVGALAYADLAALFNFDPTNGVPLTVFGRFPLRWRGGVLDDRGLVGAQFHSEMRDMPLPDWSAAFTSHRVDFARERSLRIPFTESFSLPDKMPIQARLGVPPGRPFWLTLRPDGGMSLEGPVEFAWSSNFNVRAELRLADPNYQLTLATPGLKFQGLTNLAPFLPADPRECVANVIPFDAKRALTCLTNLGRAYTHFSAAVSDCASNAPASGLPVPDYLNSVADLVEAWSYGGLGPSAQVPPVEPIVPLIAQLGIVAASTPELPEVLACRLALLRCRKVMPVGNPGVPGSPQAVLAAALAQADAAALDRAADPAVAFSLENLEAMSRLVGDSESLRSTNEPSPGPLITDVLPEFFQDQLVQRATERGVVAGQFTPHPNPAIQALDRFASAETLRHLVLIRTNLQSAGIVLGGSPLDEFYSQCAVRLLDTLTPALNEAESAREVTAFVLAARDYVELAGWTQQDLLPSNAPLGPLRDGSGLANLQTRLGALMLAAQNQPLTDPSLGRHAADLRNLLRVVRGLPSPTSLPLPPLQRLYDKVEQRLSLKLPTQETNLLSLLEYLEADALNRELAKRFSLDADFDWQRWETNRLSLVVTQLHILALPARAWRETDRASDLVWTAVRAIGYDTVAARTYARRSADLQTTSRAIAQALMQDASNTLRRVDCILPGGLEIDEPAGYISYDRSLGRWHGAARGRLRLPEFGLDLTVPNASLDSGGHFDLSAFGEVRFDGGRLAVPNRQPLHLRIGPERGVNFSGNVGLLLSNGMRFESSVTLADPLYGFALAARGLEFDLGRELVLKRPALDESAIRGFSSEAQDTLADYLRELNGTLETLVNATTGVQPIDPSGIGGPPEFVAPEITLDFSSVKAWSAEALLRAKTGLGSIQSSVEPLLASLHRLNQDARAASSVLETERSRVTVIAARQQLRRKIKEAVDAIHPASPAPLPSGLRAAAGAPVISDEDYNRIVDLLRSGAQADAALARMLVDSGLPDRLADAAEVARMLYESAEALRKVGADEPPATGLPADPCLAMLAANASTLQVADALTLCTAARHCATLGIDANTGAMVDAVVFERLNDEQLEVTVRIFTGLGEHMLAAGHPQVPFEAGIQTVVFRQRQLFKQAMHKETTGNHDPAKELELSMLLLGNVGGSQSIGLPGDTVDELESVRDTVMTGVADVVATLNNPDHWTNLTYRDARSGRHTFEGNRRAARESVERRKKRVEQDADRLLGRDRRNPMVNPDDAYYPDFFTQLRWFKDALGQSLPDDLRIQLEKIARNLVDELHQRPYTPEFLTNRLGEIETLLSGVIGLTDFAGTYLTNDPPTLNKLGLTLSNLTFSVTAVAEAQRAWWLLDRYQEALRQHAVLVGTTASTALNDALKQSREATLIASLRVNLVLTQLFNQVHFEDVVFQLPGRVEVKDIFGRLQFNRQNGLLQGCFGGRLDFPEVGTNVFFEITEACLASDGTYHVAATNSVPLPFGGASLTSGLDVRGNPQGVASFTGGGQLTVPNGTAGDQVFAVALAYDQSAHRLAFDAQGQNLDLMFGNDFVLFDAGIGFDVNVEEPAGKFRVRGSAGLIARDRTSPQPPLPYSTNFHLVVTNLSTVFRYSNDLFAVTLDNGTLILPEFFHLSENSECPAGGQTNAGPRILLQPANPINVSIVGGDQPRAFFNGALNFRNVGFDLPKFPGFAVDLCSAQLVFPTNDLPRFTNLTALMQFPIGSTTSRVDILDASWTVDGFPLGTVRLGKPLPLYDQGNFNFTLLSTNDPGCPLGTGFKFSQTNGGPVQLSLFGAIEVGLDELSIRNVDGTKIFGRACGQVIFTEGADPEFQLSTLAVGGSFFLGYNPGLRIENGSIEVARLTNFFEMSAARPVVLQLSGLIRIPHGPSLNIEDAGFQLRGLDWPKFTIGGLRLSDLPSGAPAGMAAAPLALGSPSSSHEYQPVQGLTLNVDAVGIRFLRPELPLPTLLDPTNIHLTVSASLKLPPDDPIFFARVDDLGLQLVNGELQAMLSGVGFGFEGLEFPPLTLRGIVYVGGVNSSNVFDSPDLFLAGQVGGKLSDVGVTATLALTPRGILGACLDVNAGPAGIPIDGGALGGVLLTGAAGGVTFTNASDPCDFMSLISIPSGGGAPASVAFSPLPLDGAASKRTRVRAPAVGSAEMITWEQLAAIRRREALNAQLRAGVFRSAGFQPAVSPTSSRQGSGTVHRASGLETRDTAGWKPALHAESPAAPVASSTAPIQTDDRGPSASPPNPDAPCLLEPCPPPTISLFCQPHPDQTHLSNHVIIKFTSLDEAQLNALGITRDAVSAFGSTPEELGQNIAAPIRQFIDGLLPRAELGGLLDAQQILEINTGITNVLNDIESALAGIVRDAVRDVLNSPDLIYEAITNAAYAGVPCPSVTVKLTGTLSHAAVSTFLSGTVGTVLSSDGSAGVVGTVNLVGIPVGKMRGFVSISDARGNPNPSVCGQAEAALGPLELGVLQALYSCDGCSDGLGAAFLGLGGCLGAQGDVIIHEIAGKIAPDLNPHQLTSQQILVALSTNTPLMAAFMGELFRTPNLPPGLPECFLQAMGAAWNSFQPRILVCGEAQPKLFGLPLLAELGSVYLDVTKNNVTARVGMSPTYVIGNTLLCLGTSGTICQGVFPAFDEGSVGFGLGIPDPGRFLMAGLSGQLNSPEALAAYLEDGFAYMLQEGTFTVTYKLNPFGFEIANAQGRVILPNLTQHPACAGDYVRPENLGLPSRLELLLWANATNLLGNPAWKGDSNTLAWAFPEGDPRRAQVQGLTLNRDYFPYGGVAGAMRIQMPKALVDSPPPVLGQIFENRPVLERLSAAGEYITGYLLAGSEVGMLAFYIPAPNPPCLPGLPTPRELLEEISKFDPLAVAPPDLYPQGTYPLSEGFMQGYLDGRLLGVPIAQATVTLVPPGNGVPGHFLGQAQIPPGSWMSNFLDSASATFEIRQSPPVPINLAFSNLLAQVTQATNSGNQQVMNDLAAGLGDFLTTNLPKVALAVSVSNLHIPKELTNIITAGGTGNFLAFSPWYEPGFAGVGPVAEARRNGGIALQGRMRFADFITVDNAELAVSLAEGAPLPALSGLFEVPVLEVPGLPLRNAQFAFDSDPAVGQAYLAARGELNPISFLNPVTFQPLLTIRNLTNVHARIAADFSLVRPPSGSPLPAFAIGPSRVDMPMLGPGVLVRIHGITTNDPFAFSSTGPWSAKVSIAGQLRILGPLSNEVARIGASGSSFSAELSGTGMAMGRLAITVTSSIALTAFPGTAWQQTFAFGNPGGTNRLEIASDGTFLLQGEAGGVVTNLTGLGFSSISAGAGFRLTESALTLTGYFSGGALDHVGTLPTAQGTFTVTRDGVIISGSVSVPAFNLGVFQISGGNNGVLPITAVLTNNGLRLLNGAKLRLYDGSGGYPDQDLFTLNEFTIAANGDFNVSARSGALSIPGYLNLTSGTYSLKRLSSVATLEIHSPTLTVLPNATFPSTSFIPPFTDLTVSSNGRFYANTGLRTIALPAGFGASGQLEIGYEPDPRQPGLSVSTAPINFGTVNYGSSSNRTLIISNPGSGPLRATVTGSIPGVFSTTPFDITVEPGQTASISVRFTPAAPGPTNGTLTVLHNASGGSPSIAVSGTGRAVPVLRLSTTNLAFSEVKLGQTSTLYLRVDNLGLSNLVVATSGATAPFAATPSK